MKVKRDPIPDLIRHLEYLLDYLKSDAEERKSRRLLQTSPYYRWLAYSLVRREMFELVKMYEGNPSPLFDALLDAWEGLKEWSFEAVLRQGLMHECMYWLACLKAQSEADHPFLIAPIHEGIPAISAASIPGGGKLHFRGDFILFWSNSGVANVAVVDVKSDFGSALTDKYLRLTAERYRELGIAFFLASPSVTNSSFEWMRQQKYLLDLNLWWHHRRYPLDYKSGPYPSPEPAPWLIKQQS